ncbi:MAG: hypothetical protein KAH93_00690 [Candidatus Aenigmarchaeota archaeon]|nr:hypothetical protein [Candidatus Aenigmarchaeota archaeon]
MTYSNAIEYNPNTKFNCTDIETMMLTYDKIYGPKGHNDNLFPEHTPIANITGEDSFHNIQKMFDCPRYEIMALDEGTHYTGKVIYAKKI